MMKHTLTASLSLLFAAAAMAQSIAVIDMEAVIEAHPNTPNDKQQLEMTLADYSKERDALRAELKKISDDLSKRVRDAENPMLAPAKAAEMKRAAEAAFEDFRNRQAKAESQMQQRSRDLGDLERRLIRRTSDEIRATVKAYAEKQGYDAVLLKNATLYAVPALDITDRVITLCGGTPKPRGSKASEKPATAK